MADERSGSSKSVDEKAHEMLDRLAESGEGDRMAGLDLDRLRAAMSAPGAAETIAAIQAMGSDSQAAVGRFALDFELPVLPGQTNSNGEKVRLSDRFAKRPVALVFGSYT